MIKRWLLLLHAVVLLHTFSVPAFAQADSAQQELYLEAMRFLSEGRKNDASDALKRMIEVAPQHAGAWLDLAIIQCELGNAAEAERLFQTIESRFSPPPGILEVIARNRATGCKGWQARNQFSVTLGRGMDSNVNQGASNPFFSIGSGSSRMDLELLPEYLPQRDQYTLLSTDYSRDLTPDGTTGFAQFRARQNDSLSRYNTQSLFMGVEHPWRLGSWGIRSVGALGFLNLGGRLYQKQAQLQMRVTPPLALRKGFQFTTQASASYVDYSTLVNFNSTTWELSSLLSYTNDRTQFQTSAGYMFDNGAAGRLGGDRHGWFATLQNRTRLYENIVAEAGFTQQRWRSQTPYSPGLIDEIRYQNTQLFRAGVIIPLKKPQQALHIEWRQVRNNENISVFQYNSRLLQISWQWQNF